MFASITPPTPCVFMLNKQNVYSLGALEGCINYSEMSMSYIWGVPETLSNKQSDCNPSLDLV